jgi:exodeoxyribonuclease-3
MKRFLSWNVNGIRAVQKKGFCDWLLRENPDFLAVQETKAEQAQLTDDILHPQGYKSFWNAADRKGYSGVAVYTRHHPLNVYYDFDQKSSHSEGRILILEYAHFFFLSIYFPNGNMNDERLAYKLRFYADFLAYVKRLFKTGKTVIICGDVNTAHQEIDLARPKENQNVSGFLPEERAWIDKFVDAGLVDTFRVYNQQGGQYTWWDYKTRARDRNVGWRLDYFFIDKPSLGLLRDAFIYSDVLGSDHCPIGIEINV